MINDFNISLNLFGGYEIDKVMAEDRRSQI